MGDTGQETHVRDAGGGEVEVRESPVPATHFLEPNVSDETSATLSHSKVAEVRTVEAVTQGEAGHGGPAQVKMTQPRQVGQPRLLLALSL